MSEHRRTDISFTSGGESVAGWYYRPEASSPAPCVVMGHGFAGVKEARLDAFAEQFVQAGMACLVFDYRHFGASAGKPRQLLDIRKQHQDWGAAIAYARTLDGVDAARIAIWGTSFGGGLALEIAARRNDVRAAVLHMALVDPMATTGDEGLWHTIKLVMAGLYDAARGLLRRTPYLIPAVGTAGSLAFMTVPEAEPGYYSIVTNAPSWRNAVAARIVLHMASFKPARSARRARCPLLFIVGEADRITPAPVARYAASTAPDATVVSLPGGHFDAYLGAAFEQATAAETQFLCRHLGLVPEAAAVAG